MSETHSRDDEPGTTRRASSGSMPRPTRVRIDPAVCAGFGTCLALAPGALAGDEAAAPMGERSTPHAPGMPATGAVLDAMAACPTGAIRWVEARGSNASDELRGSPDEEPGP